MQIQYKTKSTKNLLSEERQQIGRLHKRDGLIIESLRLSHGDSFVVLAIERRTNKIRGWFLYNPNYPYTCQVYVQRKYQGQGIGWKLVSKAKAKIKQRKNRRIYFNKYSWGRETTIFSKLEEL